MCWLPPGKFAYFSTVNISSRIIAISAFFIAVAMFYAPLAYGSTRPEMLPPLYALLLAAMVTGAIGFFVERRWPPVPRTVRFCMAALLLQGWIMTFFPSFPSLASANGWTVFATMDRVYKLSFNSMVLTTLLLGTFALLCDLLGHVNTRRLILLAAATAGALISVIGIVLKISGEPLMLYFWRPKDIDWNDFAFFRYHGNAGAFLNLAWPLILVFTRRAYTPTFGYAQKIVWTLASAACASALFLNASKAALVIGLLILPWPFLSRLMRLKRKTFIFLAAGFLLLVVAGLVLSSLLSKEAAFQRMTNTYDVNASFDGRIDAYRQYLDTVPEVGAFGMGPGLFQVAFPYQLSAMRNVGAAVRDYAHQDYLQTVLEWGWVGTIWWTIIVAGALYRAIWTYQQRDLFVSKTERHLVLAAILGVCGTMAESMLDFPLQVPSVRLYFLVLLALCWVSPRLLTEPWADPKRIRYRLPIPAYLFKTSSREP
jgi:hypothetical protein